MKNNDDYDDNLTTSC